MTKRSVSETAPQHINLLLSIHVAAMAVIATWMLGMGEQDFLLPTTTLLAALGSLVFTDWLGWFRLHRYVANVIMLIAAFASLSSFFELGSHQQLVAVANLLVYVQIVLLFQIKQPRIYGQLAVFSLLQVVVACLLNDQLEFGILLAVYLLVSMMGMIIFFLERETLRIGATVVWHWRRPRQQAVGGLLGSAPEVWVDLPAPHVRRMLISRRLIGPFLAMVSASFFFVVLFFYTAPRNDSSSWGTGSRQFNRVGFSPEISFQQMGKVLLSNARVMRVAYTEAATGRQTIIIGHPYYRGSLLSLYMTANGRGNWRLDIDTGLVNGLKLAPAPVSSYLLYQDILLEPTERAMLFSVFPAYAAAETPPDVRINPQTGVLFRANVSALELQHEYRYRLATTAFRYGAQLHVTPYPYRLDTPQARRQFRRQMRRLAYLDNPRAFPKLIALANEIVRTDAPNGNAYARAKALESHFLEPDRYHYSLDFDEINRLRRRGVDPIEDFVSNHRTGHCEYFASALVLMLRSQGIPARLVIGYHGGDYNYIGGYFVVRQCHAHAWVEAFLKPDEIPPNLLPESLRNNVGGWLRLDPTPVAEEDPTKQFSILDRLSKSFDYARWLWNDYILKLTSKRQQRTPFSSLATPRTISLASLIKPDYWRNLAARIAQWDYSRLWRHPFSWQAGVAAMLLCLLAFLAWQVLYWLGQFVPQLLPTHWQWQRRRRRPVAFYRRLERLLRRLDIQRRPSETPRELAVAATAWLAQQPATTAVAGIPCHVVDAYYQVRFGQWIPEPQELETIREEIDQLKRAVRQLRNRS